MIETQLKNIAYLYYPKGLCNIQNEKQYCNTEEFKRLNTVINSFYSKNDPLYYEEHNLLNEFKKHHLLKNMKDITVLSMDRCLTFELEIIQENTLIKLCMNISLIIPFYSVYILENKIKLKPYRWLTIPKRNKKKEKFEFKKYLELTSTIVEKTINFNKFPEKMHNIIIPDLTFNDIRMGQFTIFNAFFHSQYKI